MNEHFFLCSMVGSLYECSSEEEFVELWNAFCTLNEHSVIPDFIWLPFSAYCDDLMFDSEIGKVVNLRNQ